MFKSQQLPHSLTSLDLLKSAAIILVIVDHIGMFFFPDEYWWRLFGRLCVPIWFFLIGFARSRTVPAKWLYCAGTLSMGNLIFGLTLLPLNILYNLAFCRIAVDKVAALVKKNLFVLYGFALLMFLLVLHSSVLVDYGTLGLMLILLGHMNRNEDSYSYTSFERLTYFLVATSLYAASQWTFFNDEVNPMNTLQNLFLFISLPMVGLLLYFFKSVTFKTPPAGLALLTPVFQFLGRYTLEIYTLHLLIFSALGLVLGTSGEAGFLAFKILPDDILGIFTGVVAEQE